MKTVKPFRLSTLTRPYRWQGRDHLGVAVMGLVTLSPQPRLLPEQTLWQRVNEDLGANVVLDLGVPKAHAEFLASGHAYTAHQEDKTACAVRIRVGTCERSLLAIGDRHWEGGRASAPQPFTRMPVDWAHAWGGNGAAENPAGIGAEADARGLLALPNIESPDARLTHPGQRPVPASFTALDPAGPQRLAHLGTQYGQDWLEHDFPGFARDMDWRYFNAAYAQQRATTPHWAGGTPYAIWNMHPACHLIEGRLPDWTARAFLQRTDTADLEEVPLGLTTVWFLPHREEAILIWHGVASIEEDDAHDVAVLLAGLDPADAIRPREHYEAVLQRRLDRTQGALHAMRENDLLPAALQAPWDAMTQQVLENRPRVQRLHASQMRAYQNERAEQLLAGLDPDALLPNPPEPLTTPSLDELADHAAQADAQVARMRTEFEAAQREAADAGVALGLQLKADGTIAAAPGAPDGPAFDLKGQLADVPDDAPQADSLRARLHEAYRYSAHLYGPAPRLSPPAALALRTRVEHQYALDRQLNGWDMIGADLRGVDLRGANLAGALLECADLTGARLDDADLTRAVLTRAVLAGTSFTGARLRDAALSKVDCHGADFSRAHFAQTDWQESRFTDVRFVGATCQGVLMQATDFIDCNFREARLHTMSFTAQALTRVDFSAATIERTQWLQCRLDSLRFKHATLNQCGFFQCEANDADFTESLLRTSSITHLSSFAQARFAGAHLIQCGLRDLPLAGADLRGARFDGCDLSNADLSGACLDDADLGVSTLVRTRLTGASLRQAKLIGVIAAKADLTDADLHGANLFRADLGQAVLDGATGLGTAFTGEVKLWPRRPARAT